MSANWKTQAKAADYDRLRAENAKLRAALDLVLLFFRIEWDEQSKALWYSVTGKMNVTTKVLCDHIRAALNEETK